MAEDETTAIYALIENFTRETCETHLLNTNPEGDHDFSLPLDDFLRTVEKISPKRPFFLERGPHYYVRVYYNAYILEKREDAIRLASISSAMESKTRRMMGSLEGFIQFAKADQVAQTLASRLPISRFHESELERTSRWTQPSPHFSHNRECLSERPVLIQIFAKSRNEWPRTGLRHVWDQLIEHASLPEQ